MVFLSRGRGQCPLFFIAADERVRRHSATAAKFRMETSAKAPYGFNLF